MARTRYLVCYDVCHAKRLRRVAKTMEAFGTRIQYSVFECALDDLRLEKLRAALHPILHHEEDQVLFVSLGPEDSRHGLRIDAMGLPYLRQSRVVVV
ncbi:MAG: CRISPR-associated endonuclease Cas2 [Verrucomicrobiales bacterium]|nr:CRISPR-associated endonuclease Cas2 [Verrucomicrobiales bacterium]